MPDLAEKLKVLSFAFLLRNKKMHAHDNRTFFYCRITKVIPRKVDDDDFRTNPVILPLQYPAQAEQVIAA